MFDVPDLHRTKFVVKFKPGAELALLIAELIMAMFIDFKN